jgi:hypothetical protein
VLCPWFQDGALANMPPPHASHAPLRPVGRPAPRPGRASPNRPPGYAVVLVAAHFLLSCPHRCPSSCRSGLPPPCSAAGSARSGWTRPRSMRSPWRTPVRDPPAPSRAASPPTAAAASAAAAPAAGPWVVGESYSCWVSGAAVHGSGRRATMPALSGIGAVFQPPPPRAHAGRGSCGPSRSAALAQRGGSGAQDPGG